MAGSRLPSSLVCPVQLDYLSTPVIRSNIRSMYNFLHVTWSVSPPSITFYHSLKICRHIFTDVGFYAFMTGGMSAWSIQLDDSGFPASLYLHVNQHVILTLTPEFWCSWHVGLVYPADY